MNIQDLLINLKDENYQVFQSKLVPNINKEKIIGVKTPDMRKIAKTIFDSEYKEEFLNDLPHNYYEENIIHMFVIALMKDFSECVDHLDKFLPYVDCWPVSDQSSPKVFKKYHKELISYIKKWIDSNHVYTKRFGIRILMNEFLGDDFKKEYLDLVANIKGDDYYLKMMIAWYFATALCKKYDEAIVYIENHVLDSWVHKKSIQKAIESYRVTEENKYYLKKFRD